jgi:hypothetical protein
MKGEKLRQFPKWELHVERTAPPSRKKREKGRAREFIRTRGWKKIRFWRKGGPPAIFEFCRKGESPATEVLVIDLPGENRAPERVAATWLRSK